eukprot:scaffold10229_cov75-Phaeocystis_antarctica.AAC.2
MHREAERREVDDVTHADGTAVVEARTVSIEAGALDVGVQLLARLRLGWGLGLGLGLGLESAPCAPAGPVARLRVAALPLRRRRALLGRGVRLEADAAVAAPEVGLLRVWVRVRSLDAGGGRGDVPLAHEACEVCGAMQHVAEGLRPPLAAASALPRAQRAYALCDERVPTDVHLAGLDAEILTARSKEDARKSRVVHRALGVKVAGARARVEWRRRGQPSGEQRVAGGRADRHGHVRAQEAHAALADRLDVWRRVRAVGEPFAARVAPPVHLQLRRGALVEARVERHPLEVHVVDQVDHHVGLERRHACLPVDAPCEATGREVWGGIQRRPRGSV